MSEAAPHERRRPRPPPPEDPKLRGLVVGHGDVLRLLVLAVCVLVLMVALTSGRFLGVDNLSAMAFQFPELGILAIAITFSLVTGGIDLSVVSVANLASILAALILTRALPEEPNAGQLAVGITAAVFAALLAGTLCGAVNGLLIARARISPILATLGTMQLFMGLSFVITRGPAISGFPAPFLFLGNGTVFLVPVPLILLAATAFAAAILLQRTRYGVRLYLMGSNETAARFAGIPIESMLVRTYMLSGFLASIAGVLMMSHTNSAKADYGTSYLLQAVLVAILGGIHPSGGFGSIWGVVLALLSLQFLSSGFSMLRISNFTKEFTWGAFLLLTMVINRLLTERRSRGQPDLGSSVNTEGDSDTELV